MSAIEWLLWLSFVWSTFFLFAAFDLPTYLRWKRGRR